MDNWDLSAFYPEDDNLTDSDGIFYSVGQEKQVSSVESRLHTTTGVTNSVSFVLVIIIKAKYNLVRPETIGVAFYPSIYINYNFKSLLCTVYFSSHQNS